MFYICLHCANTHCEPSCSTYIYIYLYIHIMYIYIYTYSQTWIQDQFTPAPGSLFAPAEAADVVNYSDFIDSINRGEATLPVLERPTVTNGMCFFSIFGLQKKWFFSVFSFFSIFFDFRFFQTWTYCGWKKSCTSS